MHSIRKGLTCRNNRRERTGKEEEKLFTALQEGKKNQKEKRPCLS
jgi:hypothetical protein